MREIKFRAKYNDKSKWVYGHYFNNCDVGVNQSFIICHDEETGTGIEYPVSSNYLGQFTGMKDKNGYEIYEGDIVRNKDGEIYEIKFEFNAFNGRYMADVWELRIIGNVHEHPELMTDRHEA